MKNIFIPYNVLYLILSLQAEVYLQDASQENIPDMFPVHWRANTQSCRQPTAEEGNSTVCCLNVKEEEKGKEMGTKW